MKRISLIVFWALTLMSVSAIAQNSACPGFKNPNNFSGYSGQIGSKPTSTPNPITGVTGMTFNSQVYQGSALATLTSSQSTSYCGTTINNETRFRIMSTTDGPGTGSNLGKDPCTNFGLPYVPTHLDPSLTKSIRVGQCRISAEAEALYYTMEVTPQNALLFIYYAIVVQAPGHGVSGDPTFVVRVTKQQGTTWSQISDTLCYMVSSTPTSDGGTVVIGQDGWHSIGSGSSQVYYKDWAKAAVSLNKYLYQTVRIEMMIGDCSASGHYGYCYIAGDCQPMEIASSGCPAGETEVVDTLRAPTGLQNYVWFKSNSGKVEDIYNVPASVTFTQLTGNTSTENTYLAMINDFHLTEGPSAGRDTNEQTLMCQMTSALDPAKPFSSKVYVNLVNAKPIVAADTSKRCDGTVILKNRSFVPGNPAGVNMDGTIWEVYDNPSGTGQPVVTGTGAVLTYQFAEHGDYAVSMRAVSPTPTCYTDKNMMVHAMRGSSTPVNLQVSNHNLCDADSVTLMDVSSPVKKRTWIFADDSIVGRTPSEYSVYSRNFDTPENPFTLRSYNGDFVLNDTNMVDTIWCFNTKTDTIHVFVHPELSVTGDTVVCVGSRTSAHITADVPGCNFFWYRNYNHSGEQPFAQGDSLRVIPDRDTCVYYVKVVSPQNCVAWDSATAYLVRPELTMVPADGRICPGQSVQLWGGKAHHFSWTSSPYDETLDGQEEKDTVVVRPEVTTTYTMIGHGSNNCNADPLEKIVTVFPYPELKVSTSPGFIDSENPSVTFSDDSRYGVASAWVFGNSDPQIGNPVTFTFEDLATDSIAIRLSSSNALGCSLDTIFYMPVQLFSTWLPNAFTPNRASNNRFSLLTTNQLEYFSIFIYDRNGRLVFTSTDPHFAWDGTHEGQACPQGAYVYTIRYRRPGTTDVVGRQGTITLIR